MHRSFAVLLFLMASPWLPASPEDPNRLVREGLQAELEDFSAADWATRPAPAPGPGTERYLRQLRTVASAPEWQPLVRLGSLPFSQGGRAERLGVTVYPPETDTLRGTLLYVHGYMSHAANFAFTFRAFARLGFRVVTLDLPGHGLSTGPRADVGSFTEYGDAVQTWLRWVEAQGWQGPRILMAHSLGSAAVFEALRRPGAFRPDRVLFCAPLLRVDWHPLLQFGQRTMDWWWKSIPSTFGWDGYLDGYTMPVHWFAALDRWLDQLRTQGPLDLPLTIYSGNLDTVVDEAWNQAEYRRLVPGARYVLLPGKGHLFLTETRDRQEFQARLEKDLGLAN